MDVIFESCWEDVMLPVRIDFWPSPSSLPGARPRLHFSSLLFSHYTVAPSNKHNWCLSAAWLTCQLRLFSWAPLYKICYSLHPRSLICSNVGWRPPLWSLWVLWTWAHPTKAGWSAADTPADPLMVTYCRIGKKTRPFFPKKLSFTLELLLRPETVWRQNLICFIGVKAICIKLWNLTALDHTK